MDTIQAVVLNAKLRRLAGWNAQRKAAADYYGDLLADLDGVERPLSMAGNEDVWHLYVVRVQDRDRVLADLNQNGIGAGIHYPFPVHLTKAYAHLDHAAGAFPVAELAAGQILSLPLYPHISRSEQIRVVEELRATVAG